MEYRIQKDSFEPPIYWIEKLVDGEWQRVFGTTEFSAGEAWAKVEVTPEERACLMGYWATYSDLDLTKESN